MSKIGTFSVVTPCFNAVERVLATAESILGQRAVQSGRVKVQYIICDGASGDGTVERLRRQLGPDVRIVCEPDHGMYEALAKGLRLAEGEVVSYLNAGDTYHPSAFDVVADVMEEHDVRWLTGMVVLCNDRLEVTEAEVPFRYRRNLIRKGLYGQRRLPFLQQESTFWARALMSSVDLSVLSSLRYAGDYYLWHCFAKQEEPAIVASYLGGFTKHNGHLSANLRGYWDEVARLCDPSGPLDPLAMKWERYLWRNLSVRARKRWNPRLFVWDEKARRWR